MHGSWVWSAAIVCCLCQSSAGRAADEFGLDAIHSSVSFKIEHAGISMVHGRFDEYKGTLTVDKDDPAKSSLEFTIQTKSVDTNNKGRDDHLRSPDFFNAKQFPVITFKSKEIKPVSGGYDVAGDLTLHGETKPIKFTLKGGDKVIKFPPGPRGKERIGVTADFTINRKEFGMEKFEGMLGNEVYVSVGAEMVKK
jgi:polyisoprenoid-binding protein YceI